MIIKLVIGSTYIYIYIYILYYSASSVHCILSSSGLKCAPTLSRYKDSENYLILYNFLQQIFVQGLSV